MPFTGLYVTFRGLHLFHVQDICMAQNSLAVIQVRLSVKKSSKLSVFLFVPQYSCLIDVLFFLLVIHFYIHSLCMHTSIHSCILSFSCLFLRSFVLLFAVYVHCLQVSIRFVQNLLHYLAGSKINFFQQKPTGDRNFLSVAK